MRRTKANGKLFVVCINNSDYPASLELHKIYQVLPDERAAEDDFLRVIDESGEDYLYSADRFVPVELPQKVEHSVKCTTRKSAMPATNAIRRRATWRVPPPPLALTKLMPGAADRSAVTACSQSSEATLSARRCPSHPRCLCSSRRR